MIFSLNIFFCRPFTKLYDFHIFHTKKKFFLRGKNDFFFLHLGARSNPCAEGRKPEMEGQWSATCWVSLQDNGVLMGGRRKTIREIYLDLRQYFVETFLLKEMAFVVDVIN